MILNPYLYSIAEISKKAFITSPTPRTEVEAGDNFNPTVIAENADSVEFFYKNTSNAWVSISSATNTGGDIWEVASWSPTVPALAIKATVTYADLSTQEVENILFTLSIYDTFTDTNGTLITAHTPNSNIGASGWTVLSGTWEILGNTLKNTTAGTSTHTMYHDLGYKDAIFKFKCPVVDVISASTQIIFRYVDATNYFLLFHNATNTSIIQVIAGSNSTLWSDLTGLVIANKDIEIWVFDGEVKFVLNNEVIAFAAVAAETTGTKFGFKRPGAASSTTYDNIKIIPIAPQPINTDVSYTAAKLGSGIITKGFNTPKDDNGFGDFDIATVGTTNYILYSAINSSDNFAGLCLATSTTGDPHNWTAQTAYALAVNNVAGCGIHYDGSTWHVVYTDRTVGKLLHATGASLGSLTAQGEIKDITGIGLYIRQSSIIVEDGVWYVFSDIRYDVSTGEFGYIGVASGSSLSTLGAYTEVLSNVAYKDDACNLTGVSVKKNDDSGFYEMFYAGYKGRDGTNFVHTNYLAISETIDGKYKRVSASPLLDIGATSFDNISLGAPCRLPNTNILYHTYSGTAGTGGVDGITYATLS